MEDAPLREPRFQLLDGRQVLEAHLVKGPHPFALRLQGAHLVGAHLVDPNPSPSPNPNQAARTWLVRAHLVAPNPNPNPNPNQAGSARTESQAARCASMRAAWAGSGQG